MFTERIAPATSDTPVRRFFCPDCVTHITIATDFDRSSFRNWLSGHKHYLAASDFLAYNIGLIVAICDSSTGYLLPLDSVWPQLHCPPCDKRLVEGSMDSHPITCPSCGKRNAQSHGCHAHVSVRREVD
jgi:ribosomal protein S27E